MSKPAETPAAPEISIVIPAYNAASTIAQVLTSLQAQTYQSWEVIVVDDGSTDGTAEVVAGLAPEMSRLRLIRQENGGVSSARNAGIAAARYGWLLFLDADDLITPNHLARFTEAITADPEAAVVYGGWARMTPDGTLTEERCWNLSGDLFEFLARSSVFPIHAALVRRSVVQALGGFDPALRTCEDWDLWQRVARTGARFASIADVVAIYRMQASSASVNYHRMLSDGLGVIGRGHGPDVRVPEAISRHAAGLAPEGRTPYEIYYACWCAGLAIGEGADPRPLLAFLEERGATNVDPAAIADNLFQAGVLPSCCHPGQWPELWPAAEPALLPFLAELEARSRTPLLARRAQVALERMVIARSPATRPLQIGTTYALPLDITAPLGDISAPAGVERLHLTVTVEGERLGAVVLPVCDGTVLGSVVADAVAAAFPWPILGRFFARTIYPALRTEVTDEGAAFWRGELLLGKGLPAEAAKNPALAHDTIGWTVMLQELWGAPDLSGDAFYDPAAKTGPGPRREADQGRAAVEVSDALPELVVPGGEGDLAVSFTVGGAPVGVVPVPLNDGVVSPAALRSALSTAAGMELCVAAVREAVIGRPLDAAPSGLRARLAAAAKGAPWGTAAGDATCVLANRTHHPIGSSASRRAALPAACAADLLAGAAASGEAVVAHRTGEPERVLYAPSAIAEQPLRTSIAQEASGETDSSGARAYDRNFFETLFARSADPWRYTGPYEQTKYEQTLAMVPADGSDEVLEIACAEGHFTAQLAPRVRRLLATDISQIALERTAQRCADHTNIRYAHLDLARDPIPGQFNLIICSEMLYYMGDREDLRAVAQKIARALKPGGYVLTAHAHQLIDDPESPGFDWELPFGAKVIGQTFASVRGLRLVRELRTPAYRIQLFQRDKLAILPWRHRAPKVEVIPQPTPLPPSVAWQFSWTGGRGHGPTPSKVVTGRLPILMYHRVAPDGDPTLRRYRVTPEEFEEQLRYLRDVGYTTATLEQWQAAVASRRPLPGRKLLITIDDGFKDFGTYAWPLLQKYGFSATVFLVADRVGGTSSWDSAFSAPVPLMGWDEIRALRDAGVTFGSHSMSHAPLTGLTPAEVVAEVARSRAIIAERLGAPVHAFAYPYGDTDPAVQHLLGASGYVFGLSVTSGRSHLHSPLLALPRIEVIGGQGLRVFIASLES